MGRFELRLAVIVGLCVLLPVGVLAQEAKIVESKGTTEKIAYLTSWKNRYVDALTRQDFNAASQAWEKVREAARWLVQNGLPQYAEDDRPMPWPWGGSTPGGGGGGQSQPDSTSEGSPLPITVDIFDRLVVETGCCEPAELSIDESQTGFPEGLTTVDVTIHGRVVDQTGAPVDNATVRLAEAKRTASTNPRGEFSLTFFTQGFDPVDLEGGVTLVCSCISIEPVEVGFATILPTDTAHNDFSIYNSCDTPVEVTMPSKTQHGLSLEVEDCSGGHSSFGSAVDGPGKQASLGPGARCTIKVTWEPGQEMMLDQRVAIPNTASPASKCNPKVRIVGAAGPGIHVYPRELRYDGVVAVGDTTSLEMNIINPTQSDITVQGIYFEGPHDADFTATITYLSNAQHGASGDVLLRPGGDCLVRVDYSPQEDGVRLGTLILRSTDAVAPRILVPLSGLAEYRVGPPGATSTIREVPGTPTITPTMTATPNPTRPVEHQTPSPTPTPKPTSTPSRPVTTQTQTGSRSGPANGTVPMDVIITEDGAEIYLYSMNPQRRHGMVLQEGPDVNFENGTIVFTDATARAAFAGDTQGSTVFVVSENTTLKTGMYTIGTKKTLWTKLQDGALAFWEQTRDLFGEADTGPIIIDIRTPNAQVSPEGTAFWLAYDAQSATTELTVFDGRVAFKPVGIDLPPVWVEPGYEARAVGEGFPRIEVQLADPEVAGWLYDTKVMPAVLEVDRQR